MMTILMGQQLERPLLYVSLLIEHLLMIRSTATLTLMTLITDSFLVIMSGGLLIVTGTLHYLQDTIIVIFSHHRLVMVMLSSQASYRNYYNVTKKLTTTLIHYLVFSSDVEVLYVTIMRFVKLL